MSSKTGLSVVMDVLIGYYLPQCDVLEFKRVAGAVASERTEIPDDQTCSHESEYSKCCGSPTVTSSGSSAETAVSVRCSPVRRVRPDAFRRTLRLRRRTCLFRLHVQNRLPPEMLDSAQAPNSSNPPTQSPSTQLSNIQSYQLSPQNPTTGSRLSFETYLAQPVEIRYPFNYVADLFEDASPPSSPSKQSSPFSPTELQS
ncbi:hypothetical protein CRM22_001923 [Opisthorchis felineus]|uniref:Uncharacterized protein n=1 Tax=Opisthorchis felineus TaxID=147828 RepID=A0A4S2MET5_OPIFE|nr:hypothetical protein CRM22_001923 [Opisthorchis felineus]